MIVAVAGAAGAVGGAIVEALLRAGHQVYALDRDAAGLGRLQGQGVGAGRLVALLVDLEDEIATRRAVGRIVRESGAPDALIVSLAEAADERRFVETELPDWWARFRARLLPHVVIAQSVLAVLGEVERGIILWINGGQALHPHPGRSAVAVASAAQQCLPEALAVEHPSQGLHFRALVLAAPVRSSDAGPRDPAWLEGRDVAQLVLRMIETPTEDERKTIVVHDPGELRRALRR